MLPAKSRRRAPRVSSGRWSKPRKLLSVLSSCRSSSTTCRHQSGTSVAQLSQRCGGESRQHRDGRPTENSSSDAPTADSEPVGSAHRHERSGRRCQPRARSLAPSRTVGRSPTRVTLPRRLAGATSGAFSRRPLSPSVAAVCAVVTRARLPGGDEHRWWGRQPGALLRTHMRQCLRMAQRR
jgi:hypothetical protein